AWRLCCAEQKPWLVALWAALAAFATQAQFGYSTIGVATLAVTLAGVLRLSPPRSDRLRPRSNFHWLAWLPATFLIYRLVCVPLAASGACREGDERLAAQPREAWPEFERAALLEPDCDSYWSRRGAAALALA